MKVLMLNGSRKTNGCTYTALDIIGGILDKEGIDREIVQVGSEIFSCGNIDEYADKIKEKLKDTDGLVVGSPVYFAGPSGEIKAFLDRLFWTSSDMLRLKPACAVASARRGGTTATLDVLNKYFEYAEMPVVSSRYWNIVHGFTPEDVMADKEGVQIMEVLGRNMAWMLRCIDAGKKAGVPFPEPVKKIYTHFGNIK